VVRGTADTARWPAAALGARSGMESRGNWRFRALPRGNAFFERVGYLLVDELDRKAFVEVSHHARLDLAEHDERLDRRPVLRGNGGTGQRQIDDPAGHLGAVLQRQHGDRI